MHHWDTYMYSLPSLFRCFFNTELKQIKLQRSCALLGNPAKGCLMPHSLLAPFQCPGYLLFPLFFGIAEWWNIWKTQIPCLYFDVFFPVLSQISAKILLTGDAISSLWTVWRMPVQGLLLWADCVICFITFKHHLSLTCCELKWYILN